MNIYSSEHIKKDKDKHNNLDNSNNSDNSDNTNIPKSSLASHRHNLTETAKIHYGKNIPLHIEAMINEIVEQKSLIESLQEELTSQINFIKEYINNYSSNR